jgi:hypothetical protein
MSDVLSFPLEGPRVGITATPGEPGAATIHRREDGMAIGSIVLGCDERTLVIERLCIETAYRGYGAGSEAAHLLIDAAAAHGYAIVRAWAPPHLGLAVYFWFRMGLRPLHGPGPNGGLALECDLSARRT